MLLIYTQGLTSSIASFFSKLTLPKVLATVLGIALGMSSASHSVYANDSTGYIGTGGVQYLKNNNISMHSEDLFISKDEIRVEYEFANLSDHDVTETILFPLPAVPAVLDYDYANTTALYNNFNVWANGVSITPTVHVRTFMRPLTDMYDPNIVPVDTTELFKACGVTESEMMLPWSRKQWSEESEKQITVINKKLGACDNPELITFVGDAESPYIEWDSQVIYSWEQTFKANATTKIKHSYVPLVGGSVYLDKSQYPDFCVDDSTQRAFHPNGMRPYSALSYILTTGANWATPIEDFTLTVKRDVGEVVSFCWAGEGKVRKIAPRTFQVKECNFVPTHDFDVAFIQVSLD